MTAHQDGVARNSHVIGWVQAADPTIADADVVAAGKVWIDTSGGAGAWVIKVRNAGDTDWEVVGAGARGEIFLTAAGGWPSTTNGCAANTKTEYGTNDVDLFSLDFATGADEFAQWTVWMPDNWDAGTVTGKFAWTSAGGTPGETVEWNLQGRAYANDDPIDAAWGTEQAVSDTLIATNDMHYSAETPAVTLAGTPAAGELVQFRVPRDVSGDNLSDDARLLGVKIYYTKS